MILQQLTIENFRSFSGKHTLNLSPYGPGLHFMYGVNESAPELGGNGAGKSTVFEALFWCLYGKTTRNVKGGNIRTWTAGRGSVRVLLEFEIGGKRHSLLRTWGPNKLQLDERDVDQEDVDRVIGVSSDSFLHAVFISQFSTTFFDLAPTPKLAVFSKILALDVWLQRSAAAADFAKRLGEKERRVGSMMDNTKGKMHQLADQIEDLEDKAKAYEKSRKKDLKELETNRVSREKEVDSLKEQVEHLKGVEKQAEIAYQNSRQSIEQINHTHSDYGQKEGELRAEIRSLQRRKDELVKEVEEAQALIDEGVCPVCEQEIGEGHFHGTISSRNKKVANIGNEIKQKERELKKIIGDREQKNKEKAEAEKTSSGLRQEWDAQKSQLMTKRSKLDESIRELSRIDKLIESKRVDKNPYQESLDEAQGQADQLISDYERLEADYNDITYQRECHEFWIKGFKDIRLLVLESALATLEVEVNNYLVELGLLGWTVHFDVERETKSGTVSRGFVVEVQSPSTKEPVPWEAWSGGELQRLRLAGALGVANMIRRQTGLANAPLILDEPTQHLSTEGIDALLDTLASIAASQAIPVWLIDHHSLDHGGFNNILTVVKTDDGSRIRENNTRGSSGAGEWAKTA